MNTCLALVNEIEPTTREFEENIRMCATRRTREEKAVSEIPGLADFCAERRQRLEQRRQQALRNAVLQDYVQYPLENIASGKTRPCVDMHNRAISLLRRLAR